MSFDTPCPLEACETSTYFAAKFDRSDEKTTLLCDWDAEGIRRSIDLYWILYHEKISHLSFLFFFSPPPCCVLDIMNFENLGDRCLSSLP